MKEEEPIRGQEVELSPEFFSELVKRVVDELENPVLWEDHVTLASDAGQNEVTVEHLMMAATFMMGEQDIIVFSELTSTRQQTLIDRLRQCKLVASGVIQMKVTEDEVVFGIPGSI